MATEFSNIFYIDFENHENPDLLSINDIDFFRQLIEPILNKSIYRFINNPQDIITKNKNIVSNDFLFELYVQRKRNELKIKKSITIDVVEENLYSIVFNYNKFLSYYDTNEFIHVINNNFDINKLNNLELRTIEYNRWIHEIIKYFKLSIYEENMNLLMEQDLKKLPINHKILAYIAKNLKSKLIEN